jgi:hypothetical protein
MKKIFLCVFVFIYSGIAQDSLNAAGPADSDNNSMVAALDAPAKKLNLEDFKKFYIGFTSKDNSIEVITLDIKHAEAEDTAITFQYTLNTHDNREDGTGQIWPGQSRIQFQNYQEGKISLPADGKIVFESVSKDSLNYWKLREK